MKHCKLLLLLPTAAAACLLFTGCIYEYPDDAVRPGPAGAVELTVALTLNIDFEMDAGEEQFVQSHAALFAEGYAVRYIVDLYEAPAAAGGLTRTASSFVFAWGNFRLSGFSRNSSGIGKIGLGFVGYLRYCFYS